MVLGNNWIDYLIIAIFFINIALGLMRGVLREVISIMALILSFVVGIKYTQSLSNLLYHSQGTQDVIYVIAKYLGGSSFGGNAPELLALFTFALSFLLLFVGSFSILEAVAQLVPLDVLAVSGLNLTFLYRILGALLGFVRGYAFAVVLVFVLQLSPVVQSNEWNQSYYIPQFLPTANQLQAALGGSPTRT